MKATGCLILKCKDLFKFEVQKCFWFQFQNFVSQYHVFNPSELNYYLHMKWALVWLMWKYPAVQTIKLVQLYKQHKSAAAGCCNWIGWDRIDPALDIGWGKIDPAPAIGCDRIEPVPAYPVAAICNVYLVHTYKRGTIPQKLHL